MSKQQIFNIQALADSPSIESEFVNEMNEKIRRLDEYEENEQTEFYRCNHCNPIANLFPGDEIFWDDECGWLCKRCLAEEKRAREAEADRKDIIENEKKLHHKGGL